MKNTKLVLIALIACIFSVANAQEQKIRFTGSVGFGISNFFNNSGISIIQSKSNQDKLYGCVGDVNLGVTFKNSSELYLNVFENIVNMIHSTGLEESNLVGGIGLYTGGTNQLTGNIYCGLFLGGGLLFSSSKVNYLDKDYTLKDRFGTYARVNLSLEYRENDKSSFGVNSGLIVGGLKDKNLPSELSTFQDNDIHGIYSYFTGIFFKVRL